MATTPEIEAKRADLKQATSLLIDKLWLAEQARDALRDKKRKLSAAEVATAESELAQLQQDYEDARGAEAQRLGELMELITAWLPAPDTSGEGPTDEETANQEIARLEATSPIVLLPLRLETRFEDDVLKVRVYPDEIFLDAHEVALTPEEQAAAVNYYTTLNDQNNEKELWRDIVARFGVERSAYILRQMLPVFGTGGSSSMWWQSSITCGGTVFGGTHQPLFFPAVQTRSATWTRPGRATLPDRFAFVTYRNGQRNVKLGNIIPELLTLTADPKLRETGDLTTLFGDYQIANDLLWTVDFTRATELGMAVEIDDAAAGFDRLIVVGVKSSIGARDTSLHLERLLDAHHYTRGVAIIRQGSPTNNTEGQPTPYPPQENAGELSYVIERQRAPLDREFSHHCLPTDSDGHHLAMALGVPSGVFANVDRGYKNEIDRAMHMNEALWPGTYGYYLRHLFYMPDLTDANQVFTPDRLADTKRYFRNFVLARGPAPAFRIGGTPYGVLPITALELWEERNFPATSPSDAEEAKMAAIEKVTRLPLLSMLDVWKQNVDNVPRIRPDRPNPDVDVALVLSTYPSAREFRVRTGESDSVTWTRYYFMGIDVTPLFNELDEQTRDTLNLVGHDEWRPRIGRTVFAQDAALYSGTVVAPVPSEDEGLPTENFIFGIRQASVADLNTNQNVIGQPQDPNLLYAVLRHSTLMEYWREYSETHGINWIGFDIFGIASIPIPAFITPIYTNPPDISSHYAALDKIAYESTAELERLFTETLDLASHRLDAWLTAFAQRRLDDMRREQVFEELKPQGDFLGAYGWVEDLSPLTRPTENVDGVGVVESQPNTGGFIHAPSMSHASAAAVLRNGHISFRDENPAAYAIDLSSRRVRKGRRLFEAVRNGQPVGALLGYELERVLQEDYSGMQGVNELRFALRALYPLVANKSGEDGDEPAEAIAARNVVDGSLLLAAFESPSGLPYGTGGLPTVGTALYGVLQFEVGRLSELYDAAADLLTAEGAFQLVRGNIDAAVPTLNNVSQGVQPPDSVISRTARGGIAVDHRVLLVFPSETPPTLPAGWPTTATARATAEPILNGWLGQLVGNPSDVEAVVSYLDADGNVIATSGSTTSPNSVRVKLSELGLQPLDLFALAEVIAKEGLGAVLDRRIADVALADPTRRPDQPATRYKVSYEAAGARTFPAIIEILNTASAVLGASRTLAPTDLVPAAEAADVLEETEGDGVPADPHALDLRNRADTASAALSGAATVLGDTLGPATGYRAALRYASLFEPLKVFPDPLTPDDALRDAVTAAKALIETHAAGLPELVDAGAKRSEIIASATALLKAVFGASFLPLPALDPPRADELQKSLDARDALLKQNLPPPKDTPDDEAPDRYLQQTMRARQRLGRYRKLNMYGRTSGARRPRVDIVQLPHVPDERWLGLPYDTPPDEGRTAILLLNYTTGLDATVPWAGFAVDDWTEILPNQQEETGVAFHYQTPHAQAPQAVLVATPAKKADSWSFAELIGALEQTMDLMKIRAVDRDFLPFGQLLPASVFGTNANVENVVSTTVEPLVLPPDAEPLQDG